MYTNANAYMLMALRDAGALWSNFWVNKNPGMNPPAVFLPDHSACKLKLDNSMESAREFMYGENANPVFYEKLKRVMMGDTAATPAPQNANKRKQMEDAGKTQPDMQHVGLWLYKTCSLAGWHASIYSMPTK